MVCVKLLISNFGALHLKHLRVTSRGIICLHMDHGISYCTISFVICSLQVGGGFETLITKEISRSDIVPYWFPRVYSLAVVEPEGGERGHLPPLTPPKFPCIGTLSLTHEKERKNDSWLKLKVILTQEKRK